MGSSLCGERECLRISNLTWRCGTNGTPFCRRQAGARCMEKNMFICYRQVRPKMPYYRKDWFESYNDAHPESTLLVPRVWEEVEKSRRGSFLIREPAWQWLERTGLWIIWIPSSGVLSMWGGWRISVRLTFPGSLKEKYLLPGAGAEGMSQFVSVFSQAVPAEALQWEEAEAAEAFQQGENCLAAGGRGCISFLGREHGRGRVGALPFTPRGGAGLAVFSDDFAGWGVSAASASTETAVHFLCFLSNADNNTHLSKVTDTTPVHLTSYELDDFFLEGKRAVYTEMMKRSDWYQFASEPQRYEAYSGYRQEANDRLRDLLSGKTTQQDLLSWLGNIGIPPMRRKGRNGKNCCRSFSSAAVLHGELYG